jgi:hypothetical protein
LQTVAANSQGNNIKELTTLPKQCLQTSLQTKSGNCQKAATNQDGNLHPDLAEIVAVWPELPGHIKAAIKALIQTQKKGD